MSRSCEEEVLSFLREILYIESSWKIISETVTVQTCDDLIQANMLLQIQQCIVVSSYHLDLNIQKLLT